VTCMRPDRPPAGFMVSRPRLPGVAIRVGLSAFKTGESYPTVNLDSVHAKLHELSCEIIEVLHSTHVKMGDVLMPLSMALLTLFDESYLGIDENKKKPEEEPAMR
jgi:hypothetical protein